MPYGELLVYQTLTDYNERFKFTGKEHDDETGYDFFGARYYTSAASIWTSPDPHPTHCWINTHKSRPMPIVHGIR